MVHYINTQTNFQIISQYRIFCETCPTLVQNSILWNNVPTWLNNIFKPVRTKLHSGASKKSLRRCQTLKRSNELSKDSKLLIRSKMNRDREDRILLAQEQNTFTFNVYGKNTIKGTKLCFCTGIVDTSSYLIRHLFPLYLCRTPAHTVSLLNSQTRIQ